MHGKGRWLIADSEAGFSYAEAKVHVVKPDRTKAFIEAANGLPSLAANEKKCAGWLFDVLALSQIQIEAAPTPVAEIAGPNAVDGKIFQGQRSHGGKTPHGEAALRLAVLAAEGAGRDGSQRVVEAAH
jgi:hypothetical protein